MKKGFTLIELLGVVTILGVLALILFPLLLKHINNARNGISETNKLLIIDAAKDYVNDNINNYKKIQGISYCINMTDIDKYLPNLKDDNLNDIDKTKKIKITYNDIFDYQIVDNCTHSLTRGGVEMPIQEPLTDESDERPSGLYLASAPDINRYIYRGGNPNNYIWLDENGDDIKASDGSELYRIISYENDGTIKVIKKEKPGNHIWDSTLITYLNEEWPAAEILSEYIVEHDFYSGILNYPINNGVEKSLQQEKLEERTVIWNEDKKNKIGLTNITEHVESSTNIKCKNAWSSYTNNAINYDADGVWPCGVDNWMLYTKYTEWTLTDFPDGGIYWDIATDGKFAYHYGYAAPWAVRPAFYLKSNIELGGTGTETNPYYIKEI